VLYVLDPKHSAVPHEEAQRFLAAAYETLETVELTALGTLESVIASEPTAADGVVFFNPLTPEAKDDVEEFLGRASEAGAVVFPIALSAEWRRPPGAVGEAQSFDLVDQLRLRELDQEQLETVAAAFARQVLGQIQPTYSRSRLRLFLCHRREDGEDLVAAIGARLDRLHTGRVFRDLVEVQTGERAQERIEEALEGADVLIFLDTPEAYGSWWIAHEISQALGRNIPIVWIRIGGEDGRGPLPFKPAAEPHIRVEETELGPSDLQALADRILEVAFELSRAQVRTSAKALAALRRWADENNAQFERLDARRMIYELRRASGRRGYPVRAEVDIVQMFAHRPDDEDRERLERFLSEKGMGPHERECRSFDAALMLDPTATGTREVGEWSVIEHPSRFLATLPVAGTDPEVRTMLLLGAFPSESLSRQEVTQAVHAAATTWLRLGGAIVFGGHPTFTPLVIEAARFVVPGKERGRVTVYQSRWFASPDALGELEDVVDVVPTEAGADRDSSLTIMRTAMCGVAADAAVAIGGRTEEGGAHRPGVDEELALARAAGSSAFLLGGAGGRSAELAAAARRESEPWESLANPLSPEQNEDLFRTDDYELAVNLIFSSLGPGS
jgi:SLOG cluster3 family/TIR domain